MPSSLRQSPACYSWGSRGLSTPEAHPSHLVARAAPYIPGRCNEHWLLAQDCVGVDGVEFASVLDGIRCLGDDHNIATDRVGKDPRRVVRIAVVPVVIFAEVTSRSLKVRKLGAEEDVTMT